MRFACSAAVAASLLAAAAAARADPPRRAIGDAIAVEGSACLTREALAAELGAWLGRTELDTRVDLVVRELPDGAWFKVLRDGASIGERELHLPNRSCEDKRAAVSLALAVALDATVLASLGVPTVSPPYVGLVPPPAAAPPPAPAARLAPTLPPFVRIDAEVDAEALVDVLPNVAIAVAPTFDIGFGDTFGARVGALASNDVVVDVAEGTGKTRLAAARLDACIGRNVSVFRTRGCVGGFAGTTATIGKGFTRSFSTSAPMVDGVLRVEGRWRIASWIGLDMSLEGFLPAVRPQLVVVGADGMTPTKKLGLPPAGFGASLGPTIKIW